VSGFDQQAGDFSQVPDNVLADANRSINSGAKEQYSALMEALASEENLPLVFHCTHGKDRAGVASAVLLMALGVSEDIAREDYLLSNVYREEQNRTELEKSGKVSPRSRVSIRLRSIFPGLKRSTIFNLRISMPCWTRSIVSTARSIVT